MARLVNGINGPITGKVGTVSGSHRNGKAYIRANPVRRAPQTTNELAAKQRFAAAHRFLSPMLNYLREGFRHQLKKGYNGAKSYTLLNAMEGEPMESGVNPELVQVSMGELPLSADLAVSYLDGEMIFTWSTEKPTGASIYDQVMPLAYHADPKSFRVFANNTGALRKSGTDSVKVRKGLNYHIYVAFTAADRSRNSESVYLGVIEAM